MNLMDSVSKIIRQALFTFAQQEEGFEIMLSAPPPFIIHLSASPLLP